MVLVRRLMEKLRGDRQAPDARPAEPRACDRRTAPRFAADHHALVLLGSERQEARVVDFSEAGLRLQVPCPIGEGEVGRAFIHFNGCVLRREFEVVRVEGDTVGAALRPAHDAAESTMTFLQLLTWRAGRLRTV